MKLNPSPTAENLQKPGVNQGRGRVNNKIMMNTILVALLLSTLFVAYIIMQRRKIADGKAMFWATVSEPIEYVMDDPEDYGVTARAANARAKLVEHGNVFLNPETDIWEYVYSADPMFPTRDFSMWKDLVNQNVTKRREMWRKEKAGYNEGAAKEQFAGQVVNNQN